MAPETPSRPMLPLGQAGEFLGQLCIINLLSDQNKQRSRILLLFVETPLSAVSFAFSTAGTGSADQKCTGE